MTHILQEQSHRVSESSTKVSSEASEHTVALPSMQRIVSVSVIGGFLNGIKLKFDEGLNCIIGGRGTGKTTILEFVRFAIDAMPSRDGHPDERRKLDALVEKNLGGGRVQVSFQTQHGLIYVVSRTWGEPPVVLTADGQPTQLTLRSGGVFRVDIHSQNEMERIAGLSTSQLTLIDRFRSDAIAETESEIRNVERDLASNASQLLAMGGQRVSLQECVATLPDVEEQLRAFEVIGGENAGQINAAHSEKALRDRESRTINDIRSELVQFQHELHRYQGRLERNVKSHFAEDVLCGRNGTHLLQLQQRLLSFSHAIDALLEQADGELAQARQGVAECCDTLDAVHSEQDLAFRALIEQHEIVMQQAAKRTHLQRLRNDTLAQKSKLDELEKQIEKTEALRSTLFERLSELRDKRFSIRQAVAERINAAVSPMIRVTLAQFGEVGEYCQLLATALRNAGIQHNVVALKIAMAVPPRELSALVQEGNGESLCQQSGINAVQAAKVIEALRDPKTQFELELVDMNDRPTIELRDGDSYKNSLTLSTGQKCTSILPILLLDSVHPLFVDQPEDNLDNGFIYKTVVPRLNQAKANRQLIFVTHNPNIPVLGGASKVFVCTSNGSEAWIKNEGSVDDCRDDIVNLLEGGEEAFKLRQQRYEY